MREAASLRARRPRLAGAWAGEACPARPENSKPADVSISGFDCHFSGS